jgi:DNA processing protein
MSPPIATEAASILDSMGYDPVTIDALVQRCGLTADAISSMLLRMELQGTVKVMAGGHYIRVG